MATATKKKAAPVPASENAPRHQVVDEVFVWIGDGSAEQIRVPLRLKTGTLRMLVRLGKEEGADELDQLFALLDSLGDTHTQELIDDMWLEDTMDLVAAYFGEFEKKHQATPGES